MVAFFDKKFHAGKTATKNCTVTFKRGRERKRECAQILQNFFVFFEYLRNCFFQNKEFVIR